ncbi:MAG: 3-hydroxyacyl-CoA dehydrogenase NAD-binding domain-containing protein [Solirubrobacterales bacterium]
MSDGGGVAVTTVGVLGAGTMGAGIAQVAALGGLRTRLYDVVPAAAAAGAERLREALGQGVERGRWEARDAELAAARVHPTGELAELAGCELVIEAAPEDLGLKRDLLSAVAAVCGPAAVLATNTSSLRVGEIAAGVPGPERVVGMHFFNPPPLMRLVEVVAAERSSAAALATATALVEVMGKTPIRARDSPGFLANRLARPFFLEPLRMLAAGLAEAARIDRVIRLGGGFRMGPFELIDLIGLDVNLEIARSFYRQGGEPERWRPSPIQRRLVEEGKLGRKSGEGYHRYPPGAGRRAEHEPEVAAPTLEPTALERIDPAAPEILLRLFAQIANEAAFAAEEEIASPRDFDTAMRLGFNWPLGPLAIAELIGPARAVATLERFRASLGEAYAPAPRLVTAAEEASG